MDQLSFGLQKKTWLCNKQSVKLVNEDGPELKNKLQLNIVKADITVTSKLEMISSSWIRIKKIMAVVLSNWIFSNWILS